MNELVEFIFQIHYSLAYSPRKQNFIADTLRRTSANTYVESMEACTKLISSDQVKKIFDKAESEQQQSDILSVCPKTVMVETQQKILDSLISPRKCFNIEESASKKYC